MKFRWLAGIFLGLILLPVLAFAATIPLKQDVWNPASPNFPLKGPLTVCTGSYTFDQAGYQGAKCQNLCDFVVQIIQILYFIIAVGIWIIIPIIFGYSGFLIMLARGNPTKVSEARKALTGAVIGVAIMLAAWLIVNTFLGFLSLTGFAGFDKGACSVPAAAAGQ